MTRLNLQVVRTDASAFLVSKYPDLRRYCIHLTKNRWDGEDLAQETISKAYRKYGNNQENHTVSLALLYTIARNQWLDQMRVKTQKVESSAGFCAPHESIADIYAAVEIMGSKLTSAQTVIFVLKEVFQYSLADIASICGISEGAVKASLFRARVKLKNVQEEGESGYGEMEQFVDVLVESIREQRPELLMKVAPYLQFKERFYERSQVLSLRYTTSAVPMLSAA